MPAPADDFAARRGTALVTGGSGAIGAAVVRLLTERGARVALTYHGNRSAAEALVAEIRERGGAVSAHRLDLVDADATRALIAELLDRHQALHTIVHAAGPLVEQRHLSTIDVETMRAHLEQEAAPVFHLVAPALPALRDARGAIVAVTTAATRRYAVRDGLSAVPKASVEMFIRAVAAEEGRHGVRANCVGPGMLADGMAQRLIASGELDRAALDAATRNIALRRFGVAADVAEAVVFLASDRARYITGQVLPVDGGFSI